MIEGVVGNGHEGDIVIDDVIFSPGCVFTSVELPTGTMPPPTPSPCDDGLIVCDDQLTCIDPNLVCYMLRMYLNTCDIQKITISGR